MRRWVPVGVFGVVAHDNDAGVAQPSEPSAELGRGPVVFGASLLAVHPDQRAGLETADDPREPGIVGLHARKFVTGACYNGREPS